MIGFKFNYNKMFFDRKAVLSRVDMATRKVLSRFGAFVRRTARQSIRKRKKSSKPGQPPSSHTGLLKQFIFFGYEPSKGSVVIGPERLGGRGEAPPALEYGGPSHVVDYIYPKERGARREKVHRKVMIRARPFMGPAFEKEKPQLPKLWRDSVK